MSSFVGPSPSPNFSSESVGDSSRAPKRARVGDAGASPAGSPILSVSPVSEGGSRADLLARNQLAQAKLLAEAVGALSPNSGSNETLALEKFRFAMVNAENPALQIEIYTALASYLESVNRPGEPQHGLLAGRELAQKYRDLAANLAAAPQPQPEPSPPPRHPSPLPSAGLDLSQWGCDEGSLLP